MTKFNVSRDGPRKDTPWVDCTFALFVLADITIDDINHVLQKAHDGSTVNCYYFWLAHDFAYVPRENRVGETIFCESGTESPIPEEWTSLFKGKTIQEAAAFSKLALDGLQVDWHHFAVLDEGFLTLCRIGDGDLVGDDLDTMPCKVEVSTLNLSSLERHVWEEYKYD
ncbi:hypothetical protein G7Y89_g13163 [Cudoniella acicularis]|uniref:Uncharacterized protein n=1 Tax=Cudoniella acicularis TaxID=354080 RepID=A0A8H4R7X7_9HELO|nr:hypothetical protein G7Y89_g13163 [Cudoniella acicularis]